MKDYLLHRTKSPGRKSFSPSSNVTGERSATALTCRASPGPPRSSSWLALTALKCRTSMTNGFIRPRRRTRITTNSRIRSDEYCRGFSFRPDVPVRLPDLVVDPRRSRAARHNRQLAIFQPRRDQPVRGQEAPVGAGVVLRVVIDADRG